MMPPAKKTIVSLGEALWDELPSGPRLGGASANLAVMAGRLGSHAVLASRVGKDDLGRRYCREVAAFPVDLSHMQVDPVLPTSTVSVAVGAEGQPRYTIHEKIAWDAFEFTEDWHELAQQADAVCFGTLAQRSDKSRTTVQSFLAVTKAECLHVFDLNLRPPYISVETIHWSLQHASLVKLNDEELPQVLELLGLPIPPPSTEEENWLAAARTLREAFSLKLVCLTLGSNGSLLVAAEEYHRHSGIHAKVADTVGAGDAFLAAITHYALQGASLAEMNEAANRCAAWVASQFGAIPAGWPGMEAVIMPSAV
ncbi:MAG: carbohydrate kinase family protein [Acidobacteriaceae bacterium]